jgi:SAM-dependent methyltransferase
LPFLKDIAQLNPNSVTLDFGCGLGRLASAYLMEGGSCGRYYGWEPDLLALKWLKKEYSQQNSFSFGGHPLTASHTYLSGRTQPSENYEDKALAIPEKESWLKFVEGVKFDLIWTHSIFTHTYPSTTGEILKLFKEVVKPGSWIVNTFLSIDDHSERAMKAGTADRKLPLSVNGIRTYDAKNPLVCTAYTVEQINQIYLEVGFPKPEIRFGSWAGRDNGVTYQDLVMVQIPQD